MKLVEEFCSIQGESSYVGRPCYFVRAHGCNLDCQWPCDTLYARDEKTFYDSPIEQIVKRCRQNLVPLVQLTGGEPLLQIDEAADLCRKLADFKTVLVETNGTISIKPFKNAPKNVVLVVDCKTPSSGMHIYLEKFVVNIPHLRKVDQVKFVVGNRDDFDFARGIVEKFSLSDKVSEVLISPVFGMIEPTRLAEWLLSELPAARFQIQLHKLLNVR